MMKQTDIVARCICCEFEIDADVVPLDGCPRCRDRGLGCNLSLQVPAAPGSPLSQEQSPAGSTGLESRGIWRFAPRLPVVPAEKRLTLGEGNTALVELERLPDRPAGVRLWAKDESRNPTLSFKDRFMAAATSRACHLGAEVVVATSTGNGGTSAAAYAARAGLGCVVLVSPQLPQPPRRYISSLGGVLIAVTGAEARYSLMRTAVEEWGWYPLTNFAVPANGSNLFGIAGYKTIAYEIHQQLGAVPDWVVVPLSMGDGLYGIWQGFAELVALGLTDGAPKMVAVEPAAAAPVAAAFGAGERQLEAVQTVASVAYNVGSARSSEQALPPLRASGGRALAMPEEHILALQTRLATHCGLHAEASSVLAVWGACEVAQRGETAVAVVTSSGLKDPDPAAPMPEELEPIPATLDALEAALPEHFSGSSRGGPGA